MSNVLFFTWHGGMCESEDNSEVLASGEYSALGYVQGPSGGGRHHDRGFHDTGVHPSACVIKPALQQALIFSDQSLLSASCSYPLLRYLDSDEEGDNHLSKSYQLPSLGTLWLLPLHSTTRHCRKYHANVPYLSYLD